MKHFFLIITGLSTALSIAKAQSIPTKPLDFSTAPLLQGGTQPAQSFGEWKQPNRKLIDRPINLLTYQPINAAHATLTYGFFCRQELKMDKRTAMPVRFRLGSMEQCNQLEGKNR